MLITAPPIRSRVGSLLENDTDYYKEQWGFGTWSVEIKQPQLQISREYTPLPPNAGSPEKLRLYIRKEKGGEMSNYLWGLKEKGKLGLRGPKLGFELKEGITDVVFLAGGTGIAPALQVAYTLLERRKYEMDQSRPKIRILWANREREELHDENHTGISTTSNISHKIQNPVVKIITELQQKHPGCLKVMYLVDEEGTMINQKLISSAMKRDEKTIQRDTNTSMYSKLLFVSGPEGFVNHFAGPKKWQGGGEQQGGVGGILGNMGITGWKVWKL
ncbi:hypothetical protein BJ875DRAFT_506231 [Amylocarpus encephaloides]|uniref:FAD-binding FR-type domain-containing protein n=1 Tax=Amylocarpus encephaloides TaxID=45428 RepID=A0A9P7YEP6_9HELO|nr:hypothetical protein BJ875DRAFT_506231 [Amylocarpus encephaloides]